MHRVIHGWVLLFLTACGVGHIRNDGKAGVVGGTILDRFLAYDQVILNTGDDNRIRERIRMYTEQLASCKENNPDAQDLENCVLRTLFGAGTLRLLDKTSLPSENTVTSVLSTGRGSCSALVATVLGLTEKVGEPFNAVILRDHALLASRTSPASLYETLEGGRHYDSEQVLRTAGSPGVDPVYVSGKEYLPYYLDNLAARFAESGNPNLADRLFHEALEQNSDSPRIHYNYGTFLLERRRFQAAERHLNRAILLGWNDAAAYINRGAARWKLGNLALARRDFEQALESDRSNPEARLNLRRLKAEIEAARSK